MTTLTQILIGVIALFHLFVFYVESIAWTTPGAQRLFKTTPESAAATRVVALNQGVYNLFLAAGLIWSLVAPGTIGFELKLFFLSCVVIAGIVGGLSVSNRVFFFQSMPAIIAFALLLLYR